jgi:hypothetical protein
MTSQIAGEMEELRRWRRYRHRAGRYRRIERHDVAAQGMERTVVALLVPGWSRRCPLIQQERAVVMGSAWPVNRCGVCGRFPERYRKNASFGVS